MAQDKYFPEGVNKTSVNKLNLTDVKAYYHELNNPAHTFLTVAGNIKPADARSFTKNAVDQKFALDNFRSYYAVTNKRF